MPLQGPSPAPLDPSGCQAVPSKKATLSARASPPAFANVPVTKRFEPVPVRSLIELPVGNHPSAPPLPAPPRQVPGVQREVAAEPAVAVAEAVAAQLPMDRRGMTAEPGGDLADGPAGLDHTEEGATLIEVELAVGPGQEAPPRCKPPQRLGIRTSR